ncbi:HYC_CC_PP family protein [Macellibacteroides fermentans]|uniref:HYC_CC_PP family protein n=1 Tax=Macellibacteroides fermentans TaxID=879969 RepID=UPI003B95F449
MRRFLAFILIFLYVGVSTGVVINYHYCMNKLTEVSLVMTDQHFSCSNCGSDDSKDGCCSDEVKAMRISIDQNLTERISLNSSFMYVVAVLYDIQSILLTNEISSESVCHFSFYPPGLDRPPQFILYCTWLI